MTKHVPISEMRVSTDRRRISLPLAPSLEHRRLQLYVALLVADAIAVLGGFGTASWLYFGTVREQTSLLHSQVLLPIYWTIALSLQVYSLRALRRPDFARTRSALALVGAEAVLLFVGFATRSTDSFSRVSSTLGLVFSLILLLWVRAAVRPLIKARCGEVAVNTLLIDDGGDPLRVAHAYHIDAREHHLAPDLSDPHMMDRLGLYMMNMDRVMVSCPRDRRTAWALVFKSANVMGEIVDTEVNSLGVIGARRDADYGALIVSSGPLGLRSRALKRALDLTLAGSAVLVLAPLLLLVALLIKLEDNGPVFFIQQRTGRGNRFFPIFKFRSMRVAQLDSAGARSASKDDDRITRVGRFKRRLGVQNIIVIQKHDEVAGSQFQPFLARGGIAGVLLAVDDHAGIAGGNIGGAIGRPIVDDDDFHVIPLQRNDTIERIADEPAGVVRRDDDTHAGHQAAPPKDEIASPLAPGKTAGGLENTLGVNCARDAAIPSHAMNHMRPSPKKVTVMLARKSPKSIPLTPNIIIRSCPLKRPTLLPNENKTPIIAKNIAKGTNAPSRIPKARK